MDLLRAGLAAAVRESVRGRADPDQQRVVALRPLAAWGELWQNLTRLQDETERFALDKRQAIVAGIGMLSGTPVTNAVRLISAAVAAHDTAIAVDLAL